MNNSNTPNSVNVNITTLSLIKVVVFILALWFLYLIKEVLAILFVAIILASAFDPWVDFMQRKKIPRAISILLIYAILLAIIFLIVIVLVPPIVEQFKALINNFPVYYEKIIQGLEYFQSFGLEHSLLQDGSKAVKSLESGIGRAAGGVFSTVTGFFGGMISFILILVITFYMTVEEEAMKRTLRAVVPAKYFPFLNQLITKMQKKIGIWLQAQLVLSLIVGVLSYIGLLILGVDYALVLALIAALGELVPYIGPIIGAVPAVFLAFAQSPTKAILVVILYFVVQQLENHVLVPKIMQRAVGLNPIVSISVLLIGAKLGGVVGALLAIPVATALSVLIKTIFSETKEQPSSASTEE